MCDKCFEWTKGNRIQAESILNKVSEQEKLIDQLMEEGKNSSERWEIQQFNWQSQLDSYVMKTNEAAAEIQTMATSIEERNMSIDNLNKNINELKSDRAAKARQIKQLQDHCSKYKTMYEEECEERNLLKRTNSNLNSLVERFLLTSPTVDTQQNETRENPAVEPSQANGRNEASDEQTDDNRNAEQHETVGEADASARSNVNEHPETESGNPATLLGGNGGSNANQVNTELRGVSFDPQRTIWGDTIEERESNPSPQMQQQSERKMAKIYIGNIPYYTKESNLKDLFGHYIADERDIMITKEVRRGQERSLYATVDIKEDDVSEILNFNGLNVSGQQIVVEVAKQHTKHGARSQVTPNNKEDGKEKRQCRFYLQGRCNKNDECDFEHRKPCTFYERNGRCKFGESCRFAHIGKGGGKRKDGGNELLSAFLRALAPQLSKFGLNG